VDLWYGVYNKSTRVLTYGSGGHPPAVLLTGADRNSARLVQLSTPCLVVGAMSGIPYKSASVELEPYAEMFIYSDGVYEVNKPDGTMLDRDEFIEKLSEPVHQESALQQIYGFVRDLQNSDNFEDDFSILQVRF